MGMALTKATTGRGHEGTPPPSHNGGGGDPSGGNFPNYSERLKRARMGLALALTLVIVLFATFSATFVARRLFASPDIGVSPQYQRWISTPLPWTLLLINTIVLLMSTASMELARRHIARQVALAPVKSIPGVSLGEERNVPWLGITVVLGVLFLIGQWRAWLLLHAHGVIVSSTPSSSFFYLLTGMHAVHLVGGVAALLYAAFAAIRHFAIERQRIIIDIVAWYWHFMTGLWVYVLLLIGIAH